MKGIRYQLLDTIRGSVLISMIIYHAAWNLVYLYDFSWGWYQSTGAYIWQQSICWTFILLSGFCWSLGKHPIKNGLFILGCGCLITAVTMLIMPENRIVYGVLTCIGSCVLITYLLEKVFVRIPPIVGVVFAFFLFLFTKEINRGYLGYAVCRITLPNSLYHGTVAAFLGFTPSSFYSTDYFSLFPWLFLFVTGYFLYKFCEKHNLLEGHLRKGSVPIITKMGQHSLLIYLLHQPVLYCVGNLLFK